MSWNAIDTITPVMTPERAQDTVDTLDLLALPADFLANPYPVYAALQQQSPIKKMPDGSYLLTRHADLVAVYRAAQPFSSDKKVEFGPKYNMAPYDVQPYALPGRDAPLYEHHTHSLDFNEPPLHTRVRKLIMDALTRRAIDEQDLCANDACIQVTPTTTC
jgi:cytochrome P450